MVAWTLWTVWTLSAAPWSVEAAPLGERSGLFAFPRVDPKTYMEMRAPPASFAEAPEEGGLFEGDIILNPEQAAAILQGGAAAGGWRAGRNLVASRRQLWPGGVVFYDWGPEFNNSAQRRAVEAALGDLETHSCVRFRRRTSQVTYLLLRNTQFGCAAPVGFVPIGRAIDIFLGQPGCQRRGTVQHEFLHVLGFWHEHTRPDRDDHVTVNWANIRPGLEFNFFVRPSNEVQYLQMPYDYESVMHYRTVAFSKDGVSRTLEPKDARALERMGQRERFSRVDLAKLNRLYNCPPPYYRGDDVRRALGAGAGAGAGAEAGAGSDWPGPPPLPPSAPAAERSPPSRTTPTASVVEGTTTPTPEIEPRSTSESPERSASVLGISTSPKDILSATTSSGEIVEGPASTPGTTVSPKEIPSPTIPTGEVIPITPTIEPASTTFQPENPGPTSIPGSVASPKEIASATTPVVQGLEGHTTPTAEIDPGSTTSQPESREGSSLSPGREVAKESTTADTYEKLATSSPGFSEALLRTTELSEVATVTPSPEISTEGSVGSLDGLNIFEGPKTSETPDSDALENTHPPEKDSLPARSKLEETNSHRPDDSEVSAQSSTWSETTAIIREETQQKSIPAPRETPSEGDWLSAKPDWHGPSERPLLDRQSAEQQLQLGKEQEAPAPPPPRNAAQNVTTEEAHGAVHIFMNLAGISETHP